MNSRAENPRNQPQAVEVEVMTTQMTDPIIKEKAEGKKY